MFKNAPKNVVLRVFIICVLFVALNIPTLAAAENPPVFGKLSIWIESIADWMMMNLDPFFSVIRSLLLGLYDALHFLITLLPVYHIRLQIGSISFPTILAAVLPLAWFIGGLKPALIFLISFLFISSVGLWDVAERTICIALASSSIAVFFGIPTGIIMSKSNRAVAIITPLMDYMQTTSAFIYLIPVVIFFGIGVVPGMIATIIFSTPPVIRLTNLGIRGIRTDFIEAGKAFGCSYMGLLTKVELPLAGPSIMAGINQTIMFSLNMSVVAGLIGAGGLGSRIIEAIQRLQIGEGFVAGFCVTAIAISLDRLARGRGRKR